MERTPSLLSLSGCGSSSRLRSRNGDPLLPLNRKNSRKQDIPPFKVLLGHCLYRKVVIWTLMSLALVTTVVFHIQLVWVSDTIEYAKDPSTASSVEAPPDTPVQAGNAPKVDLSNTALVESVSDASQTPTIEVEDDELSREEDEKAKEQFENEANKKPWLRYP